MANIRIGLGTEFNLKNSNLGINTTTPQERLDVAGVAKAKDLKVTGVSSLTAYEGFLRSDNQIDESINLEFGNGINASLSGEIIVGTGVTVTIASVGLGTTMVGNGSGTIENTIETTDVTRAGGSQIECLKVYNTFTPPSGGTNERPYAPKPGELYYNYDFKTIEFYDGYGWRQVDNTTRSGRGINAGNRTPAINMDQIQYVNIQSLGNALDFGVLTTDAYDGAGCSSETRGIFALGIDHPAVSNIIEYITIPSAGNSIDFGNLSESRNNQNGGSSSTRGIFLGGQTPTNSDTIDYIEIGTLGNALDFGNLTDSRREGGCVTSPTRLVHIGGFDSPSTNTTDMQFITIASKGNAVFFGDTNQHSGNNTGVSNGTRGVFGGGSGGGPGGFNEKIDFITIATSGNSISFGDLTLQRGQMASTSDRTRGVFMGGRTPTTQNLIDYITITSAGNALDFGDLAQPSRDASACSDSHGGLGGF